MVQGNQQFLARFGKITGLSAFLDSNDIIVMIAEDEAMTEQVELDRLIKLTSQLLYQLIDLEGAECDSIFNSPTLQCSLPDFLKRVQKITHFSKECLVIAIIYLDRYNMNQSEFVISSTNVYRVLLTCLLLATKFQDDHYYDNRAFEFASGVSVAQLQRFQLELFAALNFNLYVGVECFEELKSKLNDVYGSEQALSLDEEG